LLRELLKAGADIDKAMNAGEIPLYMAAQWGREAVVQALNEAGADINKAVDDSSTPLQRATRRWCGC
jgi:cytohesin